MVREFPLYSSFLPLAAKVSEPGEGRICGTSERTSSTRSCTATVAREIHRHFAVCVAKYLLMIISRHLQEIEDDYFR